MAYFSNSSEGGWFDEGCEDCLHEDPGYGCPISFIQMNYNYDQCDNDKVKEILDYLVSQKNGCILRDKIIALKTGPKPDIDTVSIFEKNSSFGPQAGR